MKYFFKDYVNYEDFNKLPQKLQIYVLKLTNVKNISNLPEKLTHIKFHDKFNNRDVDQLQFNLNIKYIEFGEYFNHREVDQLPQNLIYLKFGSNFNQNVDRLPSTLMYLEFGWRFNQKVNHLPSNLLYLHFGFNFKQTIENLPQSLKYIYFGRYFNKKIIRSKFKHVKISYHDD